MGIYRKYTKCAGCAALKKEKVKGENSFKCTLGHVIQYEYHETDNVAVKPVPVDKCYKPVNGELADIKSKHYSEK